MMRKLLAMAVVAGLMSLAVVASAAPPGNRPVEEVHATMDEVGFIHMNFDWNLDQRNVASLQFDVYGGPGIGWCGFEGTTTDWHQGTGVNEDVLFLDPGVYLVSCDGDPEALVEITGNWDYSGKAGPSHYSEQGLQCKTKLLQDENPSVYYEYDVDSGISAFSDDGAFGSYEHRKGRCHDTGKPGNPHK